MKIELTKKQYWNLMRGMYMADWIANAICEQGMKEDDGIKEARNHIFSFAKEMGYEDFVDYDKESGKYYATLAMDDEPKTRALIERYNDDTFWAELAERLGERDFFNKYTHKEIKAMDDEDRFIKRMECEIAWGEEFEKHGVERLKAEEGKK